MDFFLHALWVRCAWQYSRLLGHSMTSNLDHLATANGPKACRGNPQWIDRKHRPTSF